MHVVFYDGVCGLCDRLNRFVLRRDRRDRFRFAALQGPYAAEVLARFDRDPAALDTLYVLTEGGELLARSAAALFVARELGWPWRALGALAVLPRAVLDWAYDEVAKRRYRVFGRHEACPLPSPETRAKFLG